MIWTGRELIVWGADRGVEFVGGVWRPLPDWSFGNRSGAIVSWTGREMVVLGGSDPRADVKPIYGAAYNPRTRAWRRLPDSPVPFTSPSTATWTGRALVVMQGLGRAAAYDPTTDRWRALPQPPLSLPGNPTVRAAWDGRRLVVTLNAGNGPIAGAYDPATNTWNDLPAPPATGQSVATGLFRSSNGVVQVSWYTQPFIDGYLRAAALRLSWQAISNPLRHRSICKTDVTPVRNGAVVFCNTRDLIGIDARSGRWYRLPRPPDGGVTTVAWAGNSLVAVTNDGRIVRLLLGARNI
jgi:hypothetical protein